MEQNQVWGVSQSCSKFNMHQWSGVSYQIAPSQKHILMWRGAIKGLCQSQLLAAGRCWQAPDSCISRYNKQDKDVGEALDGEREGWEEQSGLFSSFMVEKTLSPELAYCSFNFCTILHKGLHLWLFSHHTLSSHSPLLAVFSCSLIQSPTISSSLHSPSPIPGTRGDYQICAMWHETCGPMMPLEIAHTPPKETNSHTQAPRQKAPRYDFLVLCNHTSLTFTEAFNLCTLMKCPI